MYKSIILPHAQQDIRGAALWYNMRSKGLGRRFTAEVREILRFIRQNPTAFQVRYDKVRTVVLNNFPYMVHYTVEESNKTVLVIAVFHTSRDPDLWENR